jgi:uncharacterized protein YprB with RNaseH-like and TPR domain
MEVWEHYSISFYPCRDVSKFILDSSDLHKIEEYIKIDRSKIYYQYTDFELVTTPIQNNKNMLFLLNTDDLENSMYVLDAVNHKKPWVPFDAFHESIEWSHMSTQFEDTQNS